MSKPNQGGQAFPTQNEIFPNGEIEYGETGMSLRDYFAGQLIVGEMPTSHGGVERLAERAYKIADEMIKRREAN